MQKVIWYEIVTEASKPSFKEKIEELLRDGRQPRWSISLIRSDYLCQAMVKYEEEEKRGYSMD